MATKQETPTTGSTLGSTGKEDAAEKKDFKGKGKGKGRHSRPNRDSKGGKAAPRFKGCNTNDYSWINYNSEMLEMAAKIPFGKPLGLTVPFMYNGSDLPMRDAGIMTFDQLLTLGSTEDEHAPVNLAGIDLAAAIRKTNSGSYNWEFPDLLCLCGALGNALAFLGWMQRVVGRVNRVIDVNLFTAKMLTYADQVDYNDLIVNLPSLERYIQTFAARLNIFSFPKDIPYLANCYGAFRYDFVDINNRKVQYYMQRPKGFGIWNGYGTNTGSGLFYFTGKFNGTNYYSSEVARTVSDIMDLGNAILDGLANDQDVYVMMGDIRKAYNEGELFQVSIPSYPLAAPEAAVYSEEMLWQFHHVELPNSNFTLTPYPGLPSDISTYGIDYFVDPLASTIYYHYRQHYAFVNNVLTLIRPGLYECFGSTNGISRSWTDHIYDTDVDAPSTEEIVNDSRMKGSFLHEDNITSTTISGTTYLYPDFGVVSHHELYVTTRVSIFKIDSGSQLVYSDQLVASFSTITGADLDFVLSLTQFGKAPMFVGYNTANVSLIAGQIVNKTVVDDEVLTGIFRPILYSLFHCPQMK